jgi:hypothetical protein
LLVGTSLHIPTHFADFEAIMTFAGVCWQFPNKTQQQTTFGTLNQVEVN